MFANPWLYCWVYDRCLQCQQCRLVYQILYDCLDWKQQAVQGYGRRPRMSNVRFQKVKAQWSCGIKSREWTSQERGGERGKEKERKRETREIHTQGKRARKGTLIWSYCSAACANSRNRSSTTCNTYNRLPLWHPFPVYAFSSPKFLNLVLFSCHWLCLYKCALKRQLIVS